MSDELKLVLDALEAAVERQLTGQPLRNAAPMMLAVLKQVSAHRHR